MKTKTISVCTRLIIISSYEISLIIKHTCMMYLIFLTFHLNNVEKATKSFSDEKKIKKK